MNFRTTAVLFAVVIALVAGLLVYSLLPDPAGAAAGGLVDPLATAGVKADEVDRVELTRTHADQQMQKLVFVKTDGRWALTEPVPALVDSFAIESVVRELFAAKPVGHPSLQDSPSTLGLATPAYTVTLKKGDKTATVNVGVTLTGRERAVTFVSAGDRAGTPLAVRTAEVRSLFRDTDRDQGGDAQTIGKWLTDFRSKRLLSADAANPGGDLASFAVTRGGKTLELARTGDEWRFVSPPNYGVADATGDPAANATQFTGVRPLLGSLVNMQAGGVQDFIENVNPADYPKYGLAADDPAAIRVELKAKDRPPEVLFLGKRVDKDGKPVMPPKVYARVEGDSAVAAVPIDRLEAVVNTIADPQPLRSRDLIADTNKGRIDAIDGTFGGGFRLRRVAGQSEQVWAVYGGSEPADALRSAVIGLIDTLARPRAATDVLLDPADAAFAQPEVKGELKVWLDGVEKGVAVKDGKLPPEPKPAGEPTTFVFGKIEGNAVFVRRTDGGKATDFKIPTDLFLVLSKGRLTYIDPKIQSFVPSGAGELVLFRNGVRTEVKRESGPDQSFRTGKWSFVTPEADKGKPADGEAVFDVLQALSAVPTNRVVAEGGADELKKFGLDPAAPKLSAKATLTTTDKDKEREYHFGIETDDKTAVYYRQIGRPFVLLADKSTLARLTGADLSDKTIFRTDPKRVRKLYLSGWKNVTKGGKALDATLELENGVWVAKEPAGAAVDTPRVNAILTALEAPKAIAVVSAEAGAPTPPEQGFGDHPLSIIAELDDKAAVQMIVGGEDKARGGYFVKANGKTYVLPAVLLKAVLEKPPVEAK